MFITGLVFGTKLATLPELMKPNFLIVEKDELFVADRVYMFIYSLNDYKLKKKFGQKGSGPGEFNPRVRIWPYLHNDFILIRAHEKLYYFTRDGNYVKMLRGSMPHRFFYPLEGNIFVGEGRIYKPNGIVYKTLNIYDSNLKFLKELRRKQMIFQREKFFQVFTNWLEYHVYKDRIFYCDKAKEFEIEIFNNEGKKLYTISLEYKKLKLTSAHRHQVLERYRRHPEFGGNMDRLKRLIRFPEYLPAVQALGVGDGKLYVRTYKEKDGKREFFIFDINGKLLKKTFITFKEEGVFDESTFCITNGKLYRLIENYNTDLWELHVIPIE
jgi:hypothetical protein